MPLRQSPGEDPLPGFSLCPHAVEKESELSGISSYIRTPILSRTLSPQTPPKGPPPDPITWRVRALTDGFRKDNSLHSSGVWGFWRGGVFRKEKKVRPLRNCEKLLLEVIVTLLFLKETQSPSFPKASGRMRSA